MENAAESVKLTPEKEESLLRDIQRILFTKMLTSPEDTETDPFGFLAKLSPSQIGYLINPEPVKIKAIVLSRLNSEDVATIII